MLHPLANPDIRSGMLQSLTLHINKMLNPQVYKIGNCFHSFVNDSAKAVTFSLVVKINVMFTASYALFDIYEHYVITVSNGQAAHEVTGQLTVWSETQCRAVLRGNKLIINLVLVTAEIHARLNYLTIRGIFISPSLTHCECPLVFINPQKINKILLW